MRLRRLRSRKEPRQYPGEPCETPAELPDGVASPAELDLPVLGLATHSSEKKTCFKRQHLIVQGISSHRG